ncbi:MAG TPA: hypothetical protein PKI11_17250 [Candidatus Hydrogenedentes bacterium]|nr:hypothetical protein [Candidatus Hydrogenedentota bacterium]HNT88742.1 hypothetical protein [Candidatus Hydrogenedentota bacterium]
MKQHARPRAADRAGASGLALWIVIVGIVALSAVLALALFFFLIRPMLSGDAVDEAPTVPGTFFAEFKDLQITGLPDDPAAPSPILILSITLACKDPQTVQVIEANRPHFEGLLVDLYASKTKRQLSDPLEKDLVREEAMRQINALLNECGPGAGLAVTKVLHRKYTLVEQ